MLRGIDISRHNTLATITHYVRANKIDFIIEKATEGKTYKDPTFPHNIVQGVKRCFYHYARPENNTPEEEVDNFISTIEMYMKEDSLFFLDWEGTSLKYDFNWAVKFKNLFESKTGRYLYFYGSLSTFGKYKDECDSKWWIAHYSTLCSNGCIHSNSNQIIITQWSSTTIDKDVFPFTESYWKELSRSIKGYVKEWCEIATWEDNTYTYEVRRKEK